MLPLKDFNFFNFRFNFQINISKGFAVTICKCLYNSLHENVGTGQVVMVRLQLQFMG
jgi:hypothetical protein